MHNELVDAHRFFFLKFGHDTGKFIVQKDQESDPFVQRKKVPSIAAICSVVHRV